MALLLSNYPNFQPILTILESNLQKKRFRKNLPAIEEKEIRLILDENHMPIL